jgi:hypothetical protein
VDFDAEMQRIQWPTSMLLCAAPAEKIGRRQLAAARPPEDEVPVQNVESRESLGLKINLLTFNN